MKSLRVEFQALQYRAPAMAIWWQRGHAIADFPPHARQLESEKSSRPHFSQVVDIRSLMGFTGALT